MTPKEYILSSFEEWWEREQGYRMPKSKYLAKKAWKAAFKQSAVLQNAINKKISERYYEAK
jgi:hypothetical protein